MFHHLLVPLDGSQMAESALPAARYFAHQLGATVTLLHVMEQAAPAEVHGEHHITRSDEAEAYLSSVARTAFPGLRVAQHVHTAAVANVAESIVRHVDELDVDLIVMCTHGRGGLRSWLFGSIAQQVIALGRTPMLVVNPLGPDTFEAQRLLVPLDGNPDHEQGLPVAAELAHMLHGMIHLVMVVPTLGTLSRPRADVGRLLPAAMTALLDLTQRGAQAYLQRHVQRLHADALDVQVEVQRGDPADAIVRCADAADADLIVLATHGKSHMDAFWSGSTTPRLSSRSHLPILLVPIDGGHNV